MKGTSFKSWVSTKELKKGGIDIGIQVKEALSMLLYQTKIQTQKASSLINR